ncbi:hypothetical protein CO695_05020 [Providencia alcalifaciens]|nr:hypothetical protein CO695_05020 [Providencia alcalifaciens]
MSNATVFLEKNLIKNTFLFLFVFGIPFSFIPMNSSKLIFFALIMIFLLKGNIYGIKKEKIITIVILLLALVCSSLTPIIINNTEDFSNIYSTIIFSTEAFLGSILIIYFLFKKTNVNEFLYSIVIISFIQAVIILLMLFSSFFRELIFSITLTTGATLFERYDGFRGLGLAASLTYDLAVFLSISLILLSYLFINAFIGIKKMFFFWLVIFFAICITGRTGLLGASFSLLMLITLSRENINRILKLFFYSALFFLTLIILLDFLSPKTFDTLSSILTKYTFEFISNINNSGKIETESSNVLKNMYFPISENTFLWGDGMWLDPLGDGYYMHTDAGYMRTILYGGIVNSILIISVYLVGFSFIYSFQGKKKFKLTIFFIATIYFISQIKGDFLLGSSINIKLFFILLSYFSLLNFHKNIFKLIKRE